MKVIQTFLLLLFSIFLLIRCTSSVDFLPMDESHLIPVKVGNTWNYDENVMDISGNPVILDKYSGATTLHPVMSINKDTLINGEHWFGMNYFTGKDYWYLKVDTLTGVYAIIVDSTGPSLPTLMFKYPTTDSTTYNIGTNECQVTIANHFRILMGTYKTYKYFIHDAVNGVYYNYYISPGTGIIKFEINAMNSVNAKIPRQLSSWEMMSNKLN